MSATLEKPTENTLVEAAPQSTRRRKTNRAVTLAQVAKSAGVSTVAASVVLNRSTTATRVSDATRERILKAAQELSYTPNVLARSLRQKKTNIIAFYNAQNVTFNPTYPFYAAILEGVQTGCTEQRQDLLIHANFQGRSDDDIFQSLHNGQIDGLVLYVRTVTPLVERLAESHLPVVTVAEQVEGVPYVGIDEESGGRQLARHLAAKGYKRTWYRSLREAELPPTQVVRRAAFCEEATSLGLEVIHSAHIPNFDEPTPEEIEILNLPPHQRPQVVACWGDVSANGMVGYCIENGIRVPQDLAIAGFDGLPATQHPAMRLTTIRAPWSEVARVAVGLLAQQCRGEDVLLQTILPVELSEGNTT